MTTNFDRRALLKAAAALGGTALLPAPLLAAAAGAETIDLAVGSRTTKLGIWRPAAAPRGVLLFSTGHGSWPERYEPMIGAVVSAGYAVLAPLHVDSMQHPDRASFSPQQGLLERIADMKATSAHAAKAFPDVPVAAMGHSYGSLISLGLGGALADLMPMRDPSVTAVLAFSSPGSISGLVQPGAYASLAVPAMLITGTADTVPGFVTDPADHLRPIEQSPAGGKYALVIQGADHNLIGEPGAPGFARARMAAVMFLKAYVPGDKAFKIGLGVLPVAKGDRFIVRER